MKTIQLNWYTVYTLSLKLTVSNNEQLFEIIYNVFYYRKPLSKLQSRGIAQFHEFHLQLQMWANAQRDGRPLLDAVQ